MQPYIASSPKVEIIGEGIVPIVEAMSSFKSLALRVLKNHGLEDLKLGHWYNQQAWLDALKEIAESIGERTLYSIGVELPKHAKIPPEIDSIHKVLNSMDIAYHMNHRNGDIGYYKCQATGEKSYDIICDTPYPDTFNLGMITGVTRKFATDASSVKVTIDESRSLRSEEERKIAYTVNWK